MIQSIKDNSSRGQTRPEVQDSSRLSSSVRLDENRSLYDSIAITGILEMTHRMDVSGSTSRRGPVKRLVPTHADTLLFRSLTRAETWSESADKCARERPSAKEATFSKIYASFSRPRLEFARTLRSTPREAGYSLASTCSTEAEGVVVRTRRQTRLTMTRGPTAHQHHDKSPHSSIQASLGTGRPERFQARALMSTTDASIDRPFTSPRVSSPTEPRLRSSKHLDTPRILERGPLLPSPLDASVADDSFRREA